MASLDSGGGSEEDLMGSSSLEMACPTVLSTSPPEDETEALPLPCFPNQVAGHKGLSHEGGAIVVPEPGKLAKPVGRGYFAGEDRFYRTLSSYPALAAFCPAYFGTRSYGGRDYVVLEDLTHGMTRPLVVDMKIGTCTVAPDAPWTKRITHLNKDRATTTRSLGLRIVGAQTAPHDRMGSGGTVRLGKSWGKSIKPGEMSEALRTCFSADGRLCTAALSAFIPRLQELVRVLTDRPRWHLVSSSILFVFQSDEGNGTAQRTRTMFAPPRFPPLATCSPPSPLPPATGNT